MQSDKQIAANRRNALRSTGPRTEAGKRSSRLNSYKHGLTAHLDPLSAEQQQARNAFIADLINGFQPVGPAEHELARSIAETRWRLNRVPLIESQLFAPIASLEAESPEAASPETEPGGSVSFLCNPERLHLLTVYEMRLSRRAQSELRQLLSLQNARVTQAEREARRQSEETERRKNAEARDNATLETRRSAALAEAAAWLVNLDEEEGKTIDPAHVFRHRNGFDFSNSLIREEIDHTARLAFAKTLFNRRIDDLKAKAGTIKLPLAQPPSPGVPPQCFVNLR